MTQLNAATRLVATGIKDLKHEDGGRAWSFAYEGAHYFVNPANQALYALSDLTGHGKKELIPSNSPLYKKVMDAAKPALHGKK